MQRTCGSRTQKDSDGNHSRDEVGGSSPGSSHDSEQWKGHERVEHEVRVMT